MFLKNKLFLMRTIIAMMKGIISTNRLFDTPKSLLSSRMIISSYIQFIFKKKTNEKS